MNKALFLDRDGTINVDTGYVHEPEKFIFIDGIFEFCLKARQRGFLAIVITNQSGIERGYFTEADYERTNRHMLEEFSRHGVDIAGVFHCPSLSGPDRKPAPGLFIKARDMYDIDMARSINVGDKERDIEAGRAAGVGTNILFAGTFPDIDDIVSLTNADLKKYNIEKQFNRRVQS